MYRHALLIMTMLTIFSIILGGCTQKVSEPLVFEETPIISGGLGWAIVTIAYSRLSDEPGSSKQDGAIVRRGDIARVLARKRMFGTKEPGLWYRLGLDHAGSWIREDSMLLFNTEAEAIKAKEAGF